MILIARIQFINFNWRSLWQRPEQLPFFCLHLQWVSVKQLADIVSEVFKENSHSFINALLKSFWPIIYHFHHC
jgi:hypothetical protein